jgi:hypothetical protein
MHHVIPSAHLLPADGPARARAIIHLLLGRAGPALVPQPCGQVQAGLLRVGGVTLRVGGAVGRGPAP